MPAPDTPVAIWCLLGVSKWNECNVKARKVIRSRAQTHFPIPAISQPLLQVRLWVKRWGQRLWPLKAAWATATACDGQAWWGIDGTVVRAWGGTWVTPFRGRSFHYPSLGNSSFVTGLFSGKISSFRVSVNTTWFRMDTMRACWPISASQLPQL